MTPVRFTPEELRYVREQPLGRLATVDEQHAPQVVPVGFVMDEQTCDVSIVDPERIRSWGLPES
jgi:pyridoxamine 5'-phosphate oxidase family protein